MNIPKELAKYFTNANLVDYPKISIPQVFEDDRGVITNIADGLIGDVAVITSKAGSIRASHLHKTDWHLTYLVHGEMEYFWKATQTEPSNSVKLSAGECVISLPGEPHKMIFKSDSIMIAVSKNSRLQDSYESGTIRIDWD